MPRCTIDGVWYEVDEGSLLEAILAQGLYVPHLCHVDERSRPQASCGLCFVEVSGCDQPIRACERAVVDGMEVSLGTERCRELALFSFKLIMASHKLDCSSCARRGERDCEFKVIAKYLGTTFRSTYDVGMSAPAGGDLGVAGIGIDREKCVLCARCVEVCAERGVRLLKVNRRGSNSYIGAFDLEEKAKAVCLSCSACVERCPAGALSQEEL